MIKKHYRVFALALTLVLVFSLSACGAGASTSASPSDSASELTAPPSDTSSPSPSPTDTPSASAGYNVTYDGNGATSGTAPVDTGSYNSGATATVQDNTGSLAMDGYTFSGWNTSADGSGTPYSAGDTLTIDDASITLYAQWAASGDASASPSDSASPTATSSNTDTGNTNAKDTAVPDKTTVAAGGTVNFVVTTSQKVKSIQTFIDGVAGSKHTDYTDGTDTRTWNVSITFTEAGSRKVRFKCTLTSGSTAFVPSTAVTIKVTGTSTTTSTYSVTPTSDKTINTGESVTYTLSTPSSVTSVCAVVDGVKQATITAAASNSGGVKKWTVKITFNKTGTRGVKFNAYNGTTLAKTFPGTALTVVVNS